MKIDVTFCRLDKTKLHCSSSSTQVGSIEIGDHLSSAFIGLNIDLRLQVIVSRERCCQIQVATRVQYYFKTFLFDTPQTWILHHQTNFSIVTGLQFLVTLDTFQ